MAFRGSHTVTMNLALVFFLVAVTMNNVVTKCSARKINKNPSNDNDNVVAEIAAAKDPSNNKKLDKNQFPFGIPYPLPLPIPYPRLIPGFPVPVPIPIPGRMVPDMLIPPEYHFPGDSAPSFDRVPAPPPN